MAIAFEQKAPNSLTPAQVSGAATGNTSFGSLPAANNLLVLVATMAEVGLPDTFNTPTDNQDSGWTLALASAGTDSRISVWYKIVAASAGTYTVTLTTSGATFYDFGVLEFSGCKTSGVLDSQTNTNSGTGTAVTSGSITPTGNCVYVAVAGSENVDATSITSGLTERYNEPLNTVAVMGAEDTITSGAINASWTYGASIAWRALIVAFQAQDGPTINTQPTPQTCYVGQTSTFTISATSSGGALQYQWKDDGGNVGTDSDSYTTAAAILSDNGAQITCDVTDDNGTVVSNAVTWTVLPAAIIGWVRA